MSRRPELAASAADRSQAALFAALGDGTRLRLIQKLSQGGANSISELSAQAAVTRQALTKHLRVLETAGLVQAERRGREIRFTFTPDRVGEARDYLDLVAKQWDDALGRLKEFVEARPKNAGA